MRSCQRVKPVVYLLFPLVLASAGCSGGSPITRTKPDTPASSRKRGSSYYDKVYRSAAELVAGMPKESQPRGGADYAPERKLANDWLAENRISQQIEWTAGVKDVVLTETNGSFRVRLVLEGVRAFGSDGQARCYLDWGDAVAVGGEKFQARISVPHDGGDPRNQGWKYSPVDARSAQKARGWKAKKDVTLRAVISGARFVYPPPQAAGEPSDGMMMLEISVSTPSVDGYSPPRLVEK
jgi:hypothetical protein